MLDQRRLPVSIEYGRGRVVEKEADEKSEEGEKGNIYQRQPPAQAGEAAQPGEYPSAPMRRWRLAHRIFKGMLLLWSRRGYLLYRRHSNRGRFWPTQLLYLLFDMKHTHPAHKAQF